MLDILLLLTLLIQTNCEIYSSTAQLENLLETESFIIKSLKTYIEAEEARLDKLKQTVELFQKRYNNVINDKDEAFTHPIRAFGVIKSLSIDWPEVKNLLSHNISHDHLVDIEAEEKKGNVTMPDEADLDGAVEGINRAIEVYQVNVSDFAAGVIHSVKYRHSEMSASDLFLLGKRSYKLKIYDYMKLWMQQASVKVLAEDVPTVNIADALEYLAYAYYKLGNLRMAYKITDEMLDIAGNNSANYIRGSANKAYYEEIFRNRGVIEAEKNASDAMNLTKKYPTFEPLCRKDIELPAENASRLTCRYVRKSPLWFVRLEEVHKEPDIVVFHDVLTDKEMECIVELAKPKLQRALVKNGTAVIESQRRTAKLAWLYPGPVCLRSVDRKIEELTGLTLDESEAYQVVNYGLGGYYVPHWDNGDKAADFFDHTTKTIFNRLATFLVYLTDVPIGGDTVFPQLRTGVSPKKGSGLLWYNMSPNGRNHKLLHGSCPVLVGSKWILTKWIRIQTQMFHKPCDLDENKVVEEFLPPRPLVEVEYALD